MAAGLEFPGYFVDGAVLLEHPSRLYARESGICPECLLKFGNKTSLMAHLCVRKSLVYRGSEGLDEVDVVKLEKAE